MSCENSGPALRRRPACRQAAWLLVIALLPAMVAGWLHPKRPTWGWSRPAIPELSLADTARLAAPVVWVDARDEEAYQARHVPGAISLNLTHWEELLPNFIQAWRPGARVIVYCDSQKCRTSEEVAARLKRELQIENVFVLKGGWAAWLNAQKP